MEKTLNQSVHYSVRVYYPPGNTWDVHQLAYENGCICNGCPKCGQGVRPNQGYEFRDEQSARTFLEKVTTLITAEIAEGDLFHAKI